jgi:hypothetical protein
MVQEQACSLENTATLFLIMCEFSHYEIGGSDIGFADDYSLSVPVCVCMYVSLGHNILMEYA